MSILAAGVLCTGCELLVTFESVPEGTGGGGTGGAAVPQGGGGTTSTTGGSGGATTTALPECTGNAECDDTNLCTADTCEEGTCSNVPTGEGRPCGQQPAEPCQQSVCMSGMCVLQNLPDGTVVAPGDKNIPSGAGDCRDGVCIGGATTLVSNFLNCVDPVPANCVVPTCTMAGQCMTSGGASPAPAGYPCDSDGNGSLNGTCDGLGTAASNCQP